jgi:hypothetical protein
MNMTERFDHLVKIPLTWYPGWQGVQRQIHDIKNLRDWLDQLTDWQPNRYTYTIHSQWTQMNVWFLNESDAVLCALRWSQGIDA